MQEESSPSQEESLTENNQSETVDTTYDSQAGITDTNNITSTDTIPTDTNESYSEKETPLQEESSPSQEESLTENNYEQLMNFYKILILKMYVKKLVI